MFEHLLKIFGGSSPTASGQDPQLVVEAIEQVIDGTDPGLRLISGYRGKLRDAVTIALNHVDRVVGQLDSPEVFDTTVFGRSPCLRAFFASTREPMELLRSSRGFQEFLSYRDNRQLPECIALLTMGMEEKTVLGTALQGEILRRDVRQTAVNFSDHQLVTPSATEVDTRTKLKERAYNSLVGAALSRISEIRSERDRLEEHRALLRAKLGALKRTTKFDLASEMGAGDVRDDGVESVRNELEAIEARLRESSARPTTLDDYLDEIRAVLEQSEAILRLERLSVRLNRMGIKLEAHATGQGDQLSLQEVRVGPTLRRIVTLVRIPHTMMERATPANLPRTAPAQPRRSR